MNDASRSPSPPKDQRGGSHPKKSGPGFDPVYDREEVVEFTGRSPSPELRAVAGLPPPRRTGSGGQRRYTAR